MLSTAKRRKSCLFDEIGLGCGDIERYMQCVIAMETLSPATKADLGVVISIIERTGDRALLIANIPTENERHLPLVLKTIEIKAIPCGGLC